MKEATEEQIKQIDELFKEYGYSIDDEMIKDYIYTCCFVINNVHRGYTKKRVELIKLIRYLNSWKGGNISIREKTKDASIEINGEGLIKSLTLFCNTLLYHHTPSFKERKTLKYLNLTFIEPYSEAELMDIENQLLSRNFDKLTKKADLGYYIQWVYGLLNKIQVFGEQARGRKTNEFCLLYDCFSVTGIFTDANILDRKEKYTTIRNLLKTAEKQIRNIS